jgi:hypothetical protein
LPSHARPEGRFTAPRWPRSLLAFCLACAFGCSLLLVGCWSGKDSTRDDAELHALAASLQALRDTDRVHSDFQVFDGNGLQADGFIESDGPDRLRLVWHAGTPAMEYEVIAMGTRLFYRIGSSWGRELEVGLRSTLPYQVDVWLQQIQANMQQPGGLVRGRSDRVNGQECQLIGMPLQTTVPPVGQAAGQNVYLGTVRVCVRDGFPLRIAWKLAQTSIVCILRRDDSIRIEPPF